MIALVFVATMAASIVGRISVGHAVYTLGDRLLAIRIHSLELSRAYVDQETGHRGFLQTGSPDSLKLYDSGTAAAQRVIPQLRRELTSTQYADELLVLYEDELSAAATWKDQAADPQITALRAGPIPRAERDQMVLDSNVLFEKLRERYRALGSRIDSLSTEQLEHIRSVLHMANISQYVAASILAVSLIGSVIAVRRMLTHPVARLVRTVRAVADGDYDLPIDRGGPREIAEISAAVEDMRDKLEHLARFDSVTGLANRAETLTRFKMALENPRHPGARLGVLFCDIDHFKQVNDTWGHAVGDAVLSTIAARMRECVQLDDTVGRIGGDEMLILLPNVDTTEEAVAIAERIRCRVAEPINQFGLTIHTTLSIGATTSSRHGDSAASVTARADKAMYEAKEVGRNIVIGIDS